MRDSFAPKVVRSYLILFAILVLSQFRGSYASSELANIQEVKIGVINNHGQKDSLDRWTPTANYLIREVPNSLFTIIPFGSDELKSAIEDKIVDFCIVCPSLYVELEVLYNVTRIATMKSQYMKGSYHVFSAVIFSRSDRKGMEHIKDLKGKKLRGLHGRDCTTWNMACGELLRHGLDVDEDFEEVKFSLDPEEIVQAVRAEYVDVGVIRSDFYDRLIFEGEISADEFRVFHEDDKSHDNALFCHSTDLYPERVFAKLSNTSDELTELITVALLKMSDRDLAAEAVHCSGWTIPHNYQPFHDLLKMLRLSPYQNYGNLTLGGIFVKYRPWIISVSLLILLIFTMLGFTLLQTKRLNIAKQMILEQQILETSEKTQRTIGQVIHGTIGQDLTAIRLLAESLKFKDRNSGGLVKFTKTINIMLDLARKAVYDSRRIAGDLYPVMLSRQEFGCAVESYLSNVKSTFGVQYKTWFSGGMSSVDSEVYLHLYRIIQEAVHNAIRHGHAKHLLLTIEENAGSYVMSIKDDGIGFNPDNTDHKGLGLHIMKYRANAMGAHLTINKDMPRGTLITCTFSLDNKLKSSDGGRNRKDDGIKEIE